MHPKKRKHPEEKTELHPRNKHRGRYDFKQLTAVCPELSASVALNKFGDESIDFSDPVAVKMLNKALLKKFYDIEFWNIPPGYLCPPIPGRADYIHHAADLLSSCNKGEVPTGENIKCLDIGVGANCIYPIIGIKEYGWSFIGSDIDIVSIESANRIIKENSLLKDKLKLRLQKNTGCIFKGIVQKAEFIDLSVCNPPFHNSLKEAREGTLRKLKNLNGTTTKLTLNFGGKNNELWCKGGEVRFIGNMIRESKVFSSSCFWFSTLISKQASLNTIIKILKEMHPADFKIIPTGQGNKASRILAWTFLTPQQQKKWSEEKWRTHNESTGTNV